MAQLYPDPSPLRLYVDGREVPPARLPAPAQAPRLPVSSPPRLFLHGVEQPAPAPWQAPIEGTDPARSAPVPPEPLRMDVTRVWVNGVPQALPRQPLPTTPAAGPQASPLRLWVNGQLVAIESRDYA